MLQNAIDVDGLEVVCLGIALDARNQDRGAGESFVEREGREAAEREITRWSGDVTQNSETEQVRGKTGFNQCVEDGAVHDLLSLWGLVE